MADEKTEHYDIPQVDPAKHVSDEVFVLIQAFDVIDGILYDLAQEILRKMDADAAIGISRVTGLEAALADKMQKDRKFKLTELTDVVGAQDALINYIMTKGEGGSYVFRSALSVLGEHTHTMDQVKDLATTLASIRDGGTY